MEFDSKPILYTKCRLVQGDVYGKKYYYLVFEDGFTLYVNQPHDILGRLKDTSISFKRVFEADCPIQKYYFDGTIEKTAPILNEKNLLCTHEKQSLRADKQ